MKIRIESDELIVEVEGQHDVDYVGSVSTTLGKTALNLFIKGLEELREREEKEDE